MKTRKRKKGRSHKRKSHRAKARRHNPRHRKVRRSRARRHNPRHRKVRHARSKRGRARRHNPKRRIRVRAHSRRRNPRRRRNPNLSAMAKTYFGKGTMLNGLGIVGGLGLGALLKQVSSPMVNNTYYNKFYGILSIIAGVTLGLKVRKPIMKSVGTGMVAYGILDVLVSNIEGLQKFLPAIASPTGFTSISSSPAGTVQGGMSYGRSMMGASINSRGSLEVVGGNYDSTMRPEVIGDDFDVSDMMDMDF